MIEPHAWNEKLDLGHEAIDHEHHLQIALVSALAQAIEDRRPALARRLADQLHRYSVLHFGSEELLMETSAFPGREPHAAEHRTLLDAMREVDGCLDRGEEELALAFAVELRAGLAGHMAAADEKLVTHVQPPPGGARLTIAR